MVKNNPFFSIVIANYNYGHLLSSAIESIINMDSNKRELMIRRAYDTATTAFSRERWGKQWIEVLKKI